MSRSEADNPGIAVPGKRREVKARAGMPVIFRAAIFDLDGTLLDSMDVWEKIDGEFLERRGLGVPEDYVATICALGFEDAARYTIDRFGLEENVGDIVGEWNEMAAQKYRNEVKLVPHALEYLSGLRKAGIKLAVATALPEVLYRPCLENNGIYSAFDAVCSTDTLAKGKESPDFFLAVADRLALPPHECIVFEDVLPAVRSAYQAGMTVYGVYDKYSAHHRKEISAIADGYIFSFKEAPLPGRRQT